MQPLGQQVLRSPGKREHCSVPARKLGDDRVDRPVAAQGDHGIDSQPRKLLPVGDAVIWKGRAFGDAQVRAGATLVQLGKSLFADRSAALIGDQPDIAMSRHS